MKCRTPHSKLDLILWDFAHTENASDGSLNSNAYVLLLLLFLLVVVVVVVVVLVTRRQDYELVKLREPNNS
jgi:sensor domain CHASE-containing protein